MTRVLTVLGARPQFVKAAVVSSALIESGVQERIVHTGQHYDKALSDIFFEEMGIPEPAHNLGVGSGQHGEQTAAMLVAIEKVILAERPDWLLVYGDTNSTLAGALAAAKHHVPIAHVEAGLRSFNRRMPEEINRIMTDHLSSLLLCPTQTAVDHLRNEGVVDVPERHGFVRKVELVGDVMYDATIVFGEIAQRKSTALQQHGLSHGKFILATIHRAENTDVTDRLETIVQALCTIGASTTVLWPLHPRTRKVLEQTGLRTQLDASKVRLIDPVGYLDMLVLERNASCIVTDSGGVQKEAYFAGVPCVTLRDETEWGELVHLGWNTLVPPVAAQAIANAVASARTGKTGCAPFGDGEASQRIASLLNLKVARDAL